MLADTAFQIVLISSWYEVFCPVIVDMVSQLTICEFV